MGKVFIKSPEGEKIELVSSSDEKIIEGALLGAEALLNLLSDEMDLEEGYEIVQEQGYESFAQKWGGKDLKDMEF
jgi:hypothetical protein